MVISESISLTTSRDVIEAIASGKGPEQYLVALGYAGWGEGQLEQEILANAWLNTPYNKHILFDTRLLCVGGRPLDKLALILTS